METVINGTANALTNTGFSAFKASEAISYVRPYDAKATAIENYRHAVCRYRDTTKGVSVKPAKMVTIPAVVLPDEYSLLPEKARTVVVGMFEDCQDNIVRNLIDNGSNVIPWDAVSLDNCLEVLTAVRVSQRLTKEQVMAWVSVAMLPYIEQRSAQVSEAKSYTPVQATAQLAVMVNAYKDKLGRLSAAVPNLSQDDAMKLQNALKVANLGDDMSRTLLAKLHAILNPAAADENL